MYVRRERKNKEYSRWKEDIIMRIIQGNKSIQQVKKKTNKTNHNKTKQKQTNQTNKMKHQNKPKQPPQKVNPLKQTNPKTTTQINQNIDLLSQARENTYFCVNMIWSMFLFPQTCLEECSSISYWSVWVEIQTSFL